MKENRRLNRILVPLDGSRLAESVLPAAQALANCFKASIYLLHVVEERAPETIHGETHLTTARAAGSYLAGIAGRLSTSEPVQLHVHERKEQDVAQSIALHAVELESDLVALCTHGRGGVRRVLSGSIAQQVLKQAGLPLLLVRPQQPSELGAEFRLQTILVALDGTKEAEAALPLTAAIASACGAGVRLMSVVPTVQTISGDRAAAARLTPISTAAMLDAEEEAARNYLATLVARLPSQQIATDLVVERGDTLPVLAEAAGKGVDLIVLATHGRAGVGALWVGSVASGLASRVRQPLLLVPIG